MQRGVIPSVAVCCYPGSHCGNCKSQAGYKAFVSLAKVCVQELQGCANCNSQVVRRGCKTSLLFEESKATRTIFFLKRNTIAIGGHPSILDETGDGKEKRGIGIGSCHYRGGFLGSGTGTSVRDMYILPFTSPMRRGDRRLLLLQCQ